MGELIGELVSDLMGDLTGRPQFPNWVRCRGRIVIRRQYVG